VPRPHDMMESPAFRQLSLSAHRVLGRIECEHCRHGGLKNGELTVTFNDFENYGIHRHAIAPAIRECVALGFVEITQRGRSGNGDFRSANKFRLTYLHRRAGGVSPPTNEWKLVETEEQASRLARGVRPSPNGDIDSGAETITVRTPRSSGGNRTGRPLRQWRKPSLVEVENHHWHSEFAEAVQ
jgi:hypothetical protein